jgi:hypothetical protein
MKTTEVEDVLVVSSILTNSGSAAETIAALIDWRDSSNGVPDNEIVATVVDKPKAKRGKATESDDSDRVTPDPSSDEPDF